MNKSKNRSFKGDGTIRQRKDGKWEGRFKKDGLKTRYFYGKCKRDVLVKMNDYKAEAISKDNKSSNIVLNDCIEKWLIKEKFRYVKPNSYVTLQNTYKSHIRDTLGMMRMSEITTDDINKLLDQESQIRSFSTVKKIKQLLNSIFEYAIKNGEISNNPVTDAKMKKENNMPIKTKEIQIVSVEEADKIYEFISKAKDFNNHFYKHAPVIGLMLNTGLRTSEAVGLKWTDIDKDHKCLTVSRNLVVVPDYEKKNKNGNKRIPIETSTNTKSSNRTIPLNDKAIEMINLIEIYNQKNKINSEYVVVTDNETNVSQRNLQRTFDSMLAACDIKHFGLHALRHTFATRLLNSKIDIKVVSKLLGHSKIEITYNKYIHIVEEDKIKAIKLIPKI